MLAFRIGIVGTSAEQLRGIARRLRQPGGPIWEAMLETGAAVFTRSQKAVSGPVLKVRTGHLLRSGLWNVRAVSGGIAVTVGYRAIYARIHEEGGTIHVPEIVPRHAKALRFIVGWRTVFAKRTRPHTVRIPKRPYLQPAFEAELPAARQRIVQRIEAEFIGR